MHSIQKQILVKSNPDKVFSVLKDIERYSSFAKDIKRVEVEFGKTAKRVSRWSIDIEGADVEWLQEDIVDEKTRKYSFELVKGDYEKYSGEWGVRKDGNGSRLDLHMILDWGIPSFEKVIGPVLEKKTDRVIRGLLYAIKRECERKGKAG
ncbi:MAG: hypothetical protein COT00_02995 [Candidatus Omnitrophica bacterium CG07_land_8_20_14_0_80_50_8]|nr:MAG: hypothetical protein AUJ71_02430 [Candidatus Omnitrophica bacterium CG1_02_49_16]PIU40191.1 MAG: hypothetical protein COT00_02995 [Candidatus Omnitrophica bacterium CG07_land_8_20_14_0_80_50_8]